MRRDMRGGWSNVDGNPDDVDGNPDDIDDDEACDPNKPKNKWLDTECY